MATSIVIDGNNLGISNHYANSELRDYDGRPSGAIFGFVRSIRPILVRVQEETGLDSTKISVAWDSGVNWRKDVLPSYKASRVSSDVNEDLADYFDQAPRLKDLLSLLGVGQMYAEGYEADDIGGHLASVLSTNKVQSVLVTNDKDWLQLVGEYCHVWQPMKQRYVTLANFEEVTGCTSPDEFVNMKAIMGDKGDDVPGAAGVGEKKAVQYLRGELKATTAKGTPAKAYEAIENWVSDPDGFDRSMRLVDLRDMEIASDKWRLVPGALNTSALNDHFMQLGFASIIDHFANWLAPFRKAQT